MPGVTADKPRAGEDPAAMLSEGQLPNLAQLSGEAVGPECARWSEDGQLLVVLREAIQILTPTLGYARKYRQQHTFGANHAGASALGCMATSIELEADTLSTGRARNFYQADPSALSTSMWTRGWRDARWSPVGLQRAFGGCLIAALSSELEASIFAPVPHKDGRLGRWHQVQKLDPCKADPEDVAVAADERTDAAGDAEMGELDGELNERERALFEEMNAQISALTWVATERAAEGHALLVLGSRSGRVSLWKWDRSGPMCQLIRWHVVDEPISHIVSGRAKESRGGREETRLACVSPTRVHFATVTVDAEGEVTVRVTTDHTLPRARHVSVGAFSRKEKLFAIATTGEVLVMSSTDSAAPVRRFALQPREETAAEGVVQSPYVPAASIQANADDSFTVVLSNGLVYHLDSSLLRAPAGGTPRKLKPLPVSLVIVPKAGDEEAAQLEAAHSMLQTTKAVARLPAASSEPKGRAAALVIAVRSADDIAALRFRPLRGATALGAIVEAPAEVTEDELVEEAAALLSRRRGDDGASAPASVVDFRFLMLCYSRLKPSAQAVLRSRLVAELEITPHFAHESAQRALWLLLWLEAEGQTGTKLAALQTAWRNKALAEHLSATAALLLESKLPDSPEYTACVNRLAALAAGSSLDKGTQAKIIKLRGAKGLPALTSVPGHKALQGVSVDESCAACGQPVFLVPFDQESGGINEGLCKQGHRWHRCIITLKLLTGMHARQCGSCGARSVPWNESASASNTQGGERSVEQVLLEPHAHCPLCGGPWMAETSAAV